ncbi:heterokaryon incompatibility, partial [Bimuria novae-zelandiae CBS 107.79]
ALSYTWGSEEDLLEINVFGSGNATSRDVTHLSVTRNLAGALRHLRANRPMYLWIDALYINQKDDAEKSIQVANMSGIYSNVDNVIVWLGTEDAASMEGFHYFRYRGMSVEVDFRTGELHKVTGAWDTDFADMNIVLLVRSGQWKAIRALINRPWFSRLWIHQEIALARRATVILG